MVVGVVVALGGTLQVEQGVELMSQGEDRTAEQERRTTVGSGLRLGEEQVEGSLGDKCIQPLVVQWVQQLSWRGRWQREDEMEPAELQLAQRQEEVEALSLQLSNSLQAA